MLPDAGESARADTRHTPTTTVAIASHPTIIRKGIIPMKCCPLLSECLILFVRRGIGPAYRS